MWGPASAQTRASDAAPFVQGADNASFSAIAARAIQTHPELQARRSGLEAQNRSMTAAGAAFRPRVDFTGAAGYERATRLDGSGGTFSETGPNRRATLSLRQPLYDGSEVSSETERQGRIGNVRYFELRQAEDNLLLDLARAWTDIVRQRSLIDIAQANLTAHERIVGLVQSRVSSGVGRGVDLDQAQGRLSSTRLVLASDQGALAEAASRFHRAALVPPPAQLRALSLDDSALPTSEADALARAQAHSPVLRASAENHGATQAEAKARRAAFLPRVAIEGRHDLTARTATLRDAAASSLLLTFNYNLYAGGGDTAREQDALLRLAAAQQQYQDAAVGLRQAVSSNWAEFERQQAINRNAMAYVQLVLKTRDVYRTQYEIGQRSLLDLLNTENELAQAQRQETNSRMDALQAQLRLLAQSGRLFQVFGVNRQDVTLLLPPVATTFGATVEAPPAAVLSAPPAAVVSAPSPVPVPVAITTATPAAATASAAPLTRPITPAPAMAAQPSTIPAANVPATPAARVPATPSTPVAAVPDGARPARSSDKAAPIATAARMPSLLNTRLGPAVELRLPDGLSRTLTAWLQALGAGADDEIKRAYVSDGAVSPQWSVIGLQPVGVAPRQRLTLIQAEQIDDNRSFVEPNAQLAVLALLTDPGGIRCVRAAQVWRRAAPEELDSPWRIARERVVVMPDSACRAR